jgi:hypothetical protein
MFSNPFATTNRYRFSMLSDISQNIEESVKRLESLIKFFYQQKNPILQCSY